MADVREILDFIAPGLTASDEDKDTAIALAEAYRPKCLTEPKANEAVAWYAAWLLYGRQQQQEAADSGEVVPMGVKSQTDGDLSRTYIDGAGSGAIRDPAGFYARWLALDTICARLGGITVGRPILRIT
jgi:hypothetical protein